MMAVQKICSKCDKENRKDSAFCRFCGARMDNGGDLPPVRPQDLFLQKLQAIKEALLRVWEKISQVEFRGVKLSRVIIVAIIVLVVGIIYAAPTIGDYVAVNAAMGNATKSQAKGDYAAAINILNSVEGKPMPFGTKTEFENLQTKENSYLQDQNNFDLALQKENAGDLEGAQKILQAISYDFPSYSKVQSEISNVQQGIESQLQNQAQQAKDQAAAAQAEKEKAAAAAAQAAQDKAQAEAEAAAAAQAQSQANAAAAAAAAAAQQAEAQRVQQVEQSFRNELVGAYNSVSSAFSNYYVQGIQYSNAGEGLLAISSMSSAQSVVNTAMNKISDLNSRYINLPSAYYSATNNLIYAIQSLTSAMRLVVEQQGTTLDFSSEVNNYKNNYTSYMNLVYVFLQPN